MTAHTEAVRSDATRQTLLCPRCGRWEPLQEFRSGWSYSLARSCRACRGLPRVGPVRPAPVRPAPDWLATLVNAHAAGQFPQLWTIREAATRLGLGVDQARVVLADAGVRPHPLFANKRGPYRFDALDVEELRLQREIAARVLFDPTASRQRRNRRNRQARFAARQLIDGRLVAVNAKEHGSASTYTNHGCQCEPCRRAHRIRLARGAERRRARQCAS